MRRYFRRAAIALCLGLVAIQFVRPTKNLSPGPMPPEDLRAAHPMPEAIRRRLEVACYDCHSNNTRYPWYAEIQPVAWWLDWHVRDGKHELNLSNFGSYSLKRQADKLDSIVDELNERKMPLRSYTWTHRDAAFTDADIAAIVAWAEDLRDKLSEQL